MGLYQEITYGNIQKTNLACKRLFRIVVCVRKKQECRLAQVGASRITVDAPEVAVIEMDISEGASYSGAVSDMLNLSQSASGFFLASTIGACKYARL